MAFLRWTDFWLNTSKIIIISWTIDGKELDFGYLELGYQTIPLSRDVSDLVLGSIQFRGKSIQVVFCWRHILQGIEVVMQPVDFVLGLWRKKNAKLRKFDATGYLDEHRCDIQWEDWGKCFFLHHILKQTNFFNPLLYPLIGLLNTLPALNKF